MSRARDIADGTFSGSFSADSPTLVVDATNDSVGIGTTTTTNGKAVVGLTGAVVSGNTDGATIGQDGVFNLIDTTNWGSTDSTIFLVGGGSGGLGQISSAIGFARQSNADWGTQLKFYTHSPATSDLDELNERMRIDANGNFLVGTTDSDPNNNSTNTSADDGFAVTSNVLRVAKYNDNVAVFNRTGSNGTILVLRKSGTTVGDVGTRAGNLSIGTGDIGLEFHAGDNAIYPCQAGNSYALTNGLSSLGGGSYRFNTIYASNGSINTSDENQKQQIASLTNAEITAATAISKLFKTYKWNDSVDLKGDAARTHTGVIAQQVEQAMTDAGLDASKYAFWCSDTVYEVFTEVPAVDADEENGIEAQEAYTKVEHYNTAEEAPENAIERTTKGVRYAELLSFIGAATEQRLASIEARLDALEAV